MKRTKAAQDRAKAKALDAVAYGAQRFLGDLNEVNLLDADKTFRKHLDKLPKGLARRVSKAATKFEEYRWEVEALALDLDCAASDAD